jgi:hypothetical protein
MAAARLLGLEGRSKCGNRLPVFSNRCLMLRTIDLSKKVTRSTTDHSKSSCSVADNLSTLETKFKDVSPCPAETKSGEVKYQFDAVKPKIQRS